MSREIVIVDDHEAVRDALLGMVQEAGYEAVAFSNATAKPNPASSGVSSSPMSWPQCR